MNRQGLVTTIVRHKCIILDLYICRYHHYKEITLLHVINNGENGAFIVCHKLRLAY